MNLREARMIYAKIQARSEARGVAEFNAAVLSKLNGLPLVLVPPTFWVSVAGTVGFPCRRCAGTGQFITYVENNRPKGPGGICYRCEGKGWQDDGDVMRNLTFDRFNTGRPW